MLQELQGLIYQNPVLAKEEDPNAGWETADEYLSGNVRQKLRTARIYAQNNPLVCGQRGSTGKGTAKKN